MHIVLLEPLGIPQETLEQFSSNLKNMGHQFTAYDRVEDDVEKQKVRVQDADILIIANHPLRGEVIRAAKNLKYISIAFTGYDHVDQEACQEMGIQVSNAQGYATESVAELAVAMMISLLRNIAECNEAVRNQGTKVGLVGSELNGKTIGIVGTGAIGLRTAEILKGFHCKLLGYNRSESTRALDLGLEYVTLDELLQKSDIVSLHLPLNESTKGLISQEKLARMKRNALLINTARGPVVDSAALAHALNNGDIAGAGIDVFETEPPIASDHPLFHSKNTLVTPHVAFATQESMEKRADIVFENVSSWIRGEPQNIVLS